MFWDSKVGAGILGSGQDLRLGMDFFEISDFLEDFGIAITLAMSHRGDDLEA